MQYGRVEEQKALYDVIYNAEGLLRSDSKLQLLLWIDEMLDLANLKQGPFRDAFVQDYERDTNDCHTELLTAIDSYCSLDARDVNDNSE